MNALITGASRGIGRATALRLAAQFDIIALARSERDLQSLATEIDDRGGRCTPIPVDLADGGAIATALAGVEADVVVNNAGVGIMKPLLDLTPEEWHRMVDVNFNALYHVTRAVLPGMVERGRGHVVFIGSIAGRSAFVGGTCYTGTKWAAMGLSESLLFEVRERGVKVSIINPGSVASAFSRKPDPSWQLASEEVAEAVAQVINTPADVLIHRLEIRPLNKPRAAD